MPEHYSKCSGSLCLGPVMSTDRPQLGLGSTAAVALSWQLPPPAFERFFPDHAGHPLEKLSIRLLCQPSERDSQRQREKCELGGYSPRRLQRYLPRDDLIDRPMKEVDEEAGLRQKCQQLCAFPIA